ncbi:MAG: S8 family serine peptidase [Thermoplasmata archaeon]
MKKTNVLAVLVTFLIGISAVSVGVGISFHTADDEAVILVYKLGMDMGPLNEPGYSVLDEYENFVLVRTSSSKENLLRGQGYVIENLENRGHVGLHSYAFDTLNGEPDIPEELMIQEYSRGETGFYIIQFIGPIKPEWQEQVRKMGVTLHEFRNRFNFIVEMDPAVRNDVEKLDFVNWVGVYQPAYKFDQALLNQRGDVEMEVHIFGNKRSLQTAIEIAEFGGEALFASEDRVTVKASPEIIPDIARIPYVNAIELGGFGLEFYNDHATWITQTNSYNDRKVTQEGVTGEGQLVTVCDSELYTTGGGHEMWYDTVSFGDDHRKVQAYYSIGGDLNDGVYHGSHVTGSVLGDAPPYGEYSGSDGNAIGARLIHQDIGTSGGGLSVPSDMYNQAYGNSYSGGSRVHTNSWGGGSGYGTSARTSDLFIWDYKDYNILYAMANDGSGSNTLSSQSEGKNVISVGAAVNYANQNNMASFSSRGYADDGRIKPTIVHIGQGVTSASRSTSGYSSMSGTSMATPGQAGQVAQVRHYYEGGWYPSGSANAADGFNPSNALVKATIVNGAVEMTGSGAYTNDNRYPNGDQGYGRSMLDRVMYFDGDARKLISYDSGGESVALSTGETWTMDFTVDDTSQSMEATLAWSDYRGPSGASPSNPAIVNDLDLELIAPDGTKYTGNAYTGYNPGYSQPDPASNPWNGLRTGEFDGLNVEENILLLPGENNVQLGAYELRVSAHQVSEGTQPFAVVISGGVSEDVGEPPEITVTRPDGGESFNAGDSESITWGATQGDDPVDYIDLFYSVDAGANWETIELALPDTGSYSWTVPNEHSTECLVRAEAVDTEGRRGRNESDSTFTMIGTVPAAPGSLNVEHYGTVDEWEYLYNQPHRTVTDMATGLTGGGVFRGAMRKNIQADIIKEVAYYALDQANYVQGFIYSDGAGGTSPGTLLGETAVINSPGPNEWVEIPLTEPLNIGGGYYWIVFELEDPDADARPLGRYDEHVDDNAWISLDGSTWEELRDHDLIYNHAVEVLTAQYNESGTEHNLVTWDASLDDPAEVSHYNIYRAEHSDGPWDPGAVIHTTTADGSASYQYIDEYVGEDDDIYWWYVVRAVGNNDLEEENENTVQEPAVGEPPAITLTRPEGGEVFSAGDLESVTWNATQGDNPIDNVGLHYSVDGGGTWQTIEPALPDTGSYSWTVPNEHSTDCMV